MSRSLQKGVVATGLALVMAVTLLSPTIAEAGNRRNKHHRGHGRHQTRVVERHVYHEVSRSTCSSNVGVFLGGVAVGAIIGHHVDRCPPPPPPPRRVWIYDCDPCGYHNQGYDPWVSHLTVVHGVSRCDIPSNYPPNYGGHWEGR